MTVLDTKLVPKAKVLIGLYGKAATWTVTSGGTYVPATGAVSGGTSTSYSVTITPPSPYETRYIDGDVVQAGDACVYVAAQDLAFTPTNGNTVTIDGAAWRVVAVNAIYTGESIAIYEAQVRR